MTSDSPFGELADIQPAREKVAHTDTLLEELAGIGDGVIERYSTNIEPDEVYRHHDTYTAMETELAGSELKWRVSDLQELVTAYGNKDDSPEEAITRGMYTGVLASVLTQRNNKNGARTPIHLNGGGNMFPYLLYFAHTLDEVAIENFNGNYIARYAADYGGTAKSITLTNITGDWVGVGIARNKGLVGTVTLANITGKEAGETIAGDKGRVETVTLANITGYNAGAQIAGNDGRVGTVTLVNITGDMTGEDIAVENGRVDLLLAIRNKGKHHLLNNHATRTITTLDGLAKADEIQALLDELKQPNCAPQHYTRASEQLGELLRAEMH